MRTIRFLAPLALASLALMFAACSPSPKGAPVVVSTDTTGTGGGTLATSPATVVTTAPETTAPTNDPEITFAEFEQLTIDPAHQMTYADVVAIVGGEGELSSSYDGGNYPQFNTVTYTFHGTRFGNAFLIFSGANGGVLTMKSQYGLK